MDHVDEEDRRFKCDVCGRAYRHAGSLSNHKKTHDVGSFQCNICGKENPNALALKNHLRSHTSQKKYACLECGKTFKRPSQLVKHEGVHESKQTKEEPTAEREFVTREDEDEPTDCFLSSAISTLNSPSDDPADVACGAQTDRIDFMDKPPKSELDSYGQHGSLSHQTEMFECTVCFKLFNDVTDLFNHQRTHRSESPVHSPSGSSLHQFSPQNQDVSVNFCHLCQVLFSSEEEFQDHIQMHNSSPLLDQNDSAFYDSSCFNESSFYHPPVKHVSSESSHSHSGSFDLPNEQVTNSNSLFYNPEAASSNNPEMQPSTSVTNHTRASAVGSRERPFRCEICSKTYRHYGSLVNHKRSHQVGDYQCSICGKCCPHLASFKNHLRVHKIAHDDQQNWLAPPLQTMDQEASEDDPHVDGEPDESVLNGYVDPNSSQTEDFDVNKQSNTSDTFDDGSEHFQDDAESQDYIDFHGLNGSDVENSQYPENGSVDGYSCVSGQEEQEEQEEDDKDFFQCSFCGNRYNSIGALRNHMRGHIQSRSTPPSSIPSLIKQIKQEELGEGIICCLCGESFSNSPDLVNHQLLHSTEELDNVKLLDDKCELNEEKNLICGSCGIFCNSYSHLQNHECKVDANPSTADNVEDEPSDADTSLDKGERQYKCEECGRSYRHSGSLLNHKKSHKTGLFHCDVCQKNFYNLLALKSHQRSHFDVKRYNCGECGNAYKTQKQLLNHMRRHKDKPVKPKVQTLRQSRRARSVERVQPVSPSASQDFTPEKTKKKPQEFELQDSEPQESVPQQSEPQQSELQESEPTNKSEDSGDKRPFGCDVCGRTYRHAGSLANHKKSHKTGEFLCSTCNNSYPNQLALKNHLRTHFAFKRHSCLKCGKKLRSKKQLSVHVCSNLKRSRKGFRSKSSKPSANGGEKVKPVTKEKRLFTCNLCNRSYRHASSLLNHKNTHKTGHFSCTFCSKHFSNLLALRNHTRIHTQKRKYSCVTCGKAFRVASVLYNHQKIHSHTAGRFSCPDCGRSFRGRTGLQRHQCPQGQPTAEQQADKCFKCDLCERSYHHAGSLLNHKKTHSENFHHCSLCLQSFPDPLSLHAHSQMDRHSCPVCGKTFCLHAHLQSHMEVHQNNAEHDAAIEPAPLQPPRNNAEEKIYTCEHCGRTYRHAGSLLNHKNIHKTGHFVCSHCDKEFTNLLALKNHKRIHTEPKRYQCQECGKGFRVSSQLVCHRRIHTRETPFACSVCDKSFSSKANLRLHERMHPSAMEANGFMDIDIDAYL